ncbi:MAG: AmmeMemoRadiSam system protein B [Calditrichaeota bacterium]|nr:AmmeMemoRadiSam system protein B [Calditrichota bacterium]RQW01789.1 MAG: AmmeMemoRadiSam system protein B [Calditrichota bacterium]
MNRINKYREPGVAGTFYSRDKLILERELSMLLEAAPVINLPNSIQAIIVPHAGYLFSGGVAARAYSQLLNRDFKRVVVIAPSHQETFDFVSIFNGIGYRTPIGDIQIDEPLCRKLADLSGIVRFSEQGHSSAEHSLEVQLPFLQWCLPEFRLIPVVMGSQDEKLIQELSHLLSEVLSPEETLMVASTDLSHKHPDQKARRLDEAAVQAINAFDDVQLMKDVREGRIEMCGSGPAVVSMRVARNLGARHSRVLLYRNSGDITGNFKEVAGYLAAVIY